MRYPTVHASTLGGAGFLNPLAGSLLDILDLVLVEGYSSGAAVAPLGWSSPFERDLNVAVYRPASGNQLLYRIADNRLASSYQTADISGYESMSDLNTGMGAWGGLYLGKVSSTNPGNPDKYSPPWWVIGDASGFYLIIGDHNVVGLDASRGVPAAIQYVGDFESLIALDTGNSAILSHNSSSLLPSSATNQFFKSMGGYTYTQAGGKVYADPTSTTLNKSVGLLRPEGDRTFLTVPTTSMVVPMSMVAGNSVPRLLPMYLGSTEGTSYPRGKVPGLFSVYPNINGKTGDTFLNSSGDSFMIFNVASDTAGNWDQYAIQTNAW